MAMVCIIVQLLHSWAQYSPTLKPPMTIARKLKFAAFYLYLKLLRARRGAPVLGPLEQQLLAQRRVR
jgi:hypothetical protein